MSYNNLIWAAGHVRREDVANEYFQIMQNPPLNLKPNVYTYSALMHGHARSGNYHSAIFLLNRMTREEIKPNMVVFSSAIEACAEAVQYEEALAILERVKESGLRPDVAMINNVIKACSYAGVMDKAEELAQQLRSQNDMDLVTYHTMMMGNMKYNKHNTVLDLYHEARQSKAQLDGGIFSLAMLAAYQAPQFSIVPQIAETARSMGVNLTLPSYTTLIQAFVELGETEKALQCLDQMRQENLQPNTFTFAAVIAACRQYPDKVLELLKQVDDEKVEVNTVLLTTAINTLAYATTSGDIIINRDYTDECDAILRRMEKFGPEPNIYTYNTMVRAFAEAGRLNEAMGVLNRLKKRKIAPDMFTFTTLLIACARVVNGSTSSASSHVNYVNHHSSASTSSSSQQQAAAYYDPKNVSQQVNDILKLMWQYGIPPDLIAFGAALNAHRQANNSVEALETLQLMLKVKINPQPVHYNLVVRTLRAEGKTDRLYKMAIAISSKKDVRLNYNFFEIVLEALIDEGRWSECLRVLRAMEVRRFKPSIESCVNVIYLLERARQFRAALAMYRYMIRNDYSFYENAILNDIFKRLMRVASFGSTLKQAASNTINNALMIFNNDAREEGKTPDANYSCAVFAEAQRRGWEVRDETAIDLLQEAINTSL